MASFKTLEGCSAWITAILLFLVAGTTAHSQSHSPPIDIGDNTIHVYDRDSFRTSWAHHREIHPVTGEAPMAPHDFPALFSFNDMTTSLKWNLPAGVIVVFYTNWAAGGKQYVLWGTGETAQLSRDFNNQFSSWAWFYVGGVQNSGADVIAGSAARPLGAEATDEPVLDDSIQLFQHWGFNGAQLAITHVTSPEPGQLQRVRDDLNNRMSALRWNLRPGVAVVFFDQYGGGGPQFVVWGKGEFHSVPGYFNDRATAWAWIDVAQIGLVTPAEGANFCTQCGHKRPAGVNWSNCPLCGTAWSR